jgi:isopentenyl-diphosphate delta-isomerase
VLVGHSEQVPKINLDEVADYKWMTLESVRQDMEERPEIYTEWFKIIFREYYQRLVE